MKELIKDIIMLLGASLSLTLSICTLYVFTVAYSNELKKTTVYINAIGEANLELILILLLFPCFVYFWIKVIDYVIKR